ncbi:MAG: lactate dehydrogenase-like oxidoreductase, partial [Flaviaesturariibacter sp.]|nr:lactate dehydrogenase-like oxidoreductase [Flaviaesturariibacter sp.]
LNAQTRHLIDKKLISTMKKGVMLINTARGGVVNTQDVVTALYTGQIGYFGMDVYEYEKGIFFNDWSNRPLNDNLLKQLLAFENVLVTPHQGFATQEALSAIATATFHNLACWASGQMPVNEITLYIATGIDATNAN